MDADLLVVPEESFGSALQYFTGSKEHGVAMRRVALAKGFHLNEWGIFDNSQHRVAGLTEEVYEVLDLEWIPPEMGENLIEIELAKKGGNGLLKLIEYNDLKGDLQLHSNRVFYSCFESYSNIYFIIYNQYSSPKSLFFF